MQSSLQSRSQIHLELGAILDHLRIHQDLVRLSETERKTELIHQLPVLLGTLAPHCKCVLFQIVWGGIWSDGFVQGNF